MRWLVRGLIVVVALIALGIGAMWFMMSDFDSAPGAGVMSKTVVSKDGTKIAYEQSGSGPVVIVVAAALADHTGATKVSRHLAKDFTVINYDRRGRGASSDTAPYAVQREVEDIQALIEANGGEALLFGTSSGSVLALEAASRLGAQVKRVFMYEPPFIVDSSQPPIPETLGQEIGELAAAGKSNEAVRMFFTRAMGLPGFAVTMMRYLMPGWSKMVAVAHTAPYDLAILAGTQSGGPLPKDRWSAISAPVRVAVGSKSEPFFHTGAKALAALLPNTTYVSLEGRDHSAILMAPQALADAAREFFSERP